MFIWLRDSRTLEYILLRPPVLQMRKLKLREGK